MDSNEIRRLFVSFFAERGHRNVPSSSLIPPPDERTLLFTNAGMNQMKPYFMGMAEPPARRMTSIQKCFRTSDIEEVGDATHHTFFEMLGNFSVGDYFKAEAITWAWELLTEPQPKGMGFDRERIWATVFEDDDEAFELWNRYIPDGRIVRFDESENYWFMIKGGAGPCGPNTEIYYDYGAEHGCGEPDCAPPTHDCGRFVELWNLVFMSLYQEEDGQTRRPLPMKNVDTGAGLERWSPVHMWQEGIDWQGKPRTWTSPPSNYDTDLFRLIIGRIEELSGIEYDKAGEEQKRAMRVVAEHTRAATFLIADGVTPANDGRGYVLRRLIRRAAYFSTHVLRIRSPHPLEGVSVAIGGLMHDVYPELLNQAPFISRTLIEEENRFGQTLLTGRNALESLFNYRESLRRQFLAVANDPTIRQQEAAAEITLDRFASVYGPSVLPEPLKRAFVNSYEARLGGNYLLASSDRLREVADMPPPFSGEAAFVLWDTYGFPPELAREIAKERGFEVDPPEAFDQFMEEQRARSRAAARFEGGGERIQTYAELALQPSEFLGYETTRAGGTVLAMLLDGRPVESVSAAEVGPAGRMEVVLDRTPFYAEGGGQVGDKGEIVGDDGRFVVEDTQHVGEGGLTAHIGRLETGTLRVGDAVDCRVDEGLREDTMRNHTATHILHAALRKVLGSHVRQAGSLVAPDRLRFDFTHLEAMTPEQIHDVEALANRVVRENLTVHVEYKSYEEAIEEGALAFFGDKYADTVRVVGVCDVELHDCFSHELCGGTHVHASGEVGAIVITGETSIGAGMRRIEAVTGRAAAERVRQHEDLLARVGASLQAPVNEIEAKLAALREENERLRRQVQTLERRAAREASQGLSATTIGDTAVVVERVDATGNDALREVGDGIKNTHKSAVILLGAVINEKPTFVAMSTPDVSKRCPAGDVVRAAAQAAGGNGGGRPESAQGGGTDPSKLEAALAAGRKLIEEKLTG